MFSWIFSFRYFNTHFSRNLVISLILDLISICTELEILEINFERYYHDEVFIQPKVAHPKLIEVRFRGGNNHSFYAAINRFLELNSILEILKIEGGRWSISIVQFYYTSFLVQTLYPVIPNNPYRMAPIIDTTSTLNSSTLWNVTALHIYNVDSQKEIYINNLILLLQSVPNIKTI